jgi:glutathione synthase
VTSPTGIRAIARLGGPDIAGMIWDTVEKKRQRKA